MVVHIDTKHTSYILGEVCGLLSCIYYGKRIRKQGDYSALFERFDVCYGSMVAYSSDDDSLGLDDVCLEYGTLGRGDFREPALDIVLSNGSDTLDLVFVSHEQLISKPDIPFLPSAYDSRGTSETHLFTLRDEIANITVKLYYTAFYESDVITRHTQIINESGATVTLKRAMSAQLDLPFDRYDLITFTGCWGSERNKTVKRLSSGIYINETKQGVSSARANPFVMLKTYDADELHGDAYGFNLIYSGNHAEIIEVTHLGKTRMLFGINPSTFTWELESGDSFHTPEAVMTFSHEGLSGVSRHMHDFVNENIVRGEWKHKPRPVLINNWEGTWMDFSESKLIGIAKEASKLGIELFVLDDGWFGERNDDTKGLGDWDVNTKKLPHGIDGLQKRIKALGMDFGLWVEPEMVNVNSNLYREHPEWAIKLPDRDPALGRNQLILDLTRPDVREYIIEKMDDVFNLAEISYIKWDNNRNFSDVHTDMLPPHRQGEFFHRYILGLYEILSALTARFPHILFESCASGGNRFDLGMLCYMPQIWASDNTDPVCRMRIQTGTSYGYPLSTIGAHVAASPHHATLRSTPIETRFNVAAFGVLGYEMDLTQLTPFDKKCIAAQVDYYKAHRQVLQFGRIYRISTVFESNRPVALVVNEDGTEAIAQFFQHTAYESHTHDILRLAGLRDELDYEITGRDQFVAIKTFGSLVRHALPIKLAGDGIPMALLSSRYMFPVTPERYTAGGDILNHAGIKLKQQFGGTGYNENIRILSDYGSMLYYIKAK
ncbi:MAG: alpha-galactosidase [Clostridia bacterium]